MSDMSQHFGMHLPLGGPDVDKDYWIEIPCGEFLLGSNKERDPQARFVELPQQVVGLETFYIGQFTVTNAQFEAFVTAPDGYDDRQWWTDVGWDWKEERITPDEHSSPVFRLPTHPRVYVSWYEAYAFSQWLGKQLACNIRLPNEVEWEKAARGTTGNLYPWGDYWNPAKLNSAKSKLRQTSAVGSFVEGASPYGVLHMAGNVREWCLTKFLPINPYDYEFWHYANGLNKMDNSIEGDCPRVLRGGSWQSSPSGCRCASRSGSSPYGRNECWGFRVAIGSTLNKS
ncbi:formylglycine-generating enzyme family protein [Chloroflexota bacterium]